MRGQNILVVTERIALNLSVMLGNYLQQMTSADDIFRCIFFLGPLRVNIEDIKSLQNLN